MGFLIILSENGLGLLGKIKYLEESTEIGIGTVLKTVYRGNPSVCEFESHLFRGSVLNWQRGGFAKPVGHLISGE